MPVKAEPYELRAKLKTPCSSAPGQDFIVITEWFLGPGDRGTTMLTQPRSCWASELLLVARFSPS